MKKITGKATALVLALALVVTSFSSTFAFAASKTVSGTADFGTDEIYLANRGDKDSGSDAQKTISNLNSIIDASIETADHTVGEGPEISAISHASGDQLVKWSIDKDGKADLTLKNVTKSGKEVLSVLVKGTYNDNDGNEITVKGRKNITVYVLDSDDYIIAKTTTDDKTGKSLDELDTFAQTAGSSQTFSVYKVAPGTDALATYTAQPITLDKGALTGAAALVESTNTSDIHLDVAGNVVTATVGKGAKVAPFTGNASVGSFNITSKKIAAGAVSDKSADKTTFKAQIEKKVDTTALNPSTNYTITKDKGTTILKGVANSNILGDAGKADTVVTGAEVKFSTTGNVTVDEKTNVKKISGSVGKLDIGDATVGSVDLSAGAVTLADGRVGDIATEKNSVTVSSGKAGNITVKDSGVVINGGTVGTIETKNDNAGTVEVVSNDDDTPIVTGKITAPSVEVNSDNASSKITVDGIKVTKDNGTVTFVGSNLTVKAIDLDYRTTTLTAGDADAEFVGTIPAPVNAKNATFTTVNEDTDATVSGDVTLDTISLASDSNVKFTGKVSVGTIDGDGVLSIAAGKLYVDNSASGATLKLTDATLPLGTTVLTAKADTLGTEDLNTYGFTLSKSSGNSVDTFKIASLTFAGVQVNKSSAKIAKDYSETFTATAYPTGTNIPADAKIAWSLDGNEDVFQVTTNGNAATVKVLKVDADFASENTATLSAKLVDANGDEITDYAPAKVALTALAVPEATSDTTKDFSVAQGGKYTFKITSTTAPSFTLGTAGVFTSALTKQSGNDYFYTITATGAVGKATGVYLNGTKLLVASVKAPVANFKSDTTTAIKVAAGKSYTYKITSATAPSFGFGTTGVFTVSGITKSGNDYFYKVTAVGKAGAATGVFVNGVKVNVATVG